MVVKWLPNLLTGIRLALIPTFLYVLTQVPPPAPDIGAMPAERVGAALLLLVIGITDFADGLAARRFDAVTRLGSVADVVADRLALLLPLFYFALAQPAAFPPVPLLVPLWLLGLDVLAGGAWLLAWTMRGVPVPREHGDAGRVATNVFFALLAWIVLGLPPLGVTALAAAGLGLSTVSVGLYIRSWWTR